MPSNQQHVGLLRRHRTVLNPRKVLPFAPNGIDASQYNSSLTTECKIPEISETIKVTGPTIVPAGEVFDCQFAKYQYDDTSCELERELGNKYAVFNLEEGATLKNCFLGFSQESVHCLGTCTVENSHWLQICDDAVMFHMESGNATVTGSSFSNAGNKALQFNVGGTLSVENSCFNNVDIVYRSCGSGCKSREKRSVIFKDIEIKGVNTLAGYNCKDGDTVEIVSYTGEPAKNMCQAKDAENKEDELPLGCNIDQ